MMYKLLPFVAAVAAEEFMGRSLSTAAAAKPEGMGFNIAGSAVIRTGHGYTGGETLLYEVCADGKAQHPLVKDTIYTTVAVTGDNAANWFTLKKADNTAITLTAATGTDYTAQTECATWTQIFAGANDVVVCGAVGIAAGGGTDPVACATAVAKDDTATPKVAAHSKFSFKKANGDAHAMADGTRVRYTAGTSAANTPAPMAGMANGSYYTANKSGTSTEFMTLTTEGATPALVNGADATVAANKIPADAGATPHKFSKVGKSWKSITTTAKPAAGSSNFHVMVATVFSAFFYLMM